MGVIKLAFLALFAFGSNAASVPENDYNNNDDDNFFDFGKKWVVLVAGSDGWHNYRHQADVCHAYQLIRENGIPEENIITMMVDDIAFNYRNPTQGKIINLPNGTNVYDGVVIDYSGSDVTVNNFLSVISGNKTGLTGIGSGKVVNGGPFDKIFINFVDHGSVGLIGFPNEVLFADQLNDVLNEMYLKKSYSKMLLYIEACESGSMFDGILREDQGVLAVTAAGPRESSWGCYCGRESQPYDTCLGDLFSVTWMEGLDEILDTAFLKNRDIFNDFAEVRYKVEDSNVMVYGDFKTGLKKLSCFIGYRKCNNNQSTKKNLNTVKEKMTMPSRDINADEIKYQLVSDKISNEERKELEKEIRQNNIMKSIIDNVFREIRLLVIKAKPEIENLIGEFDQPKNLDLTLDMFPCYRSLIDKISKSCFSVPRNRYTFKRLRIIANLCIIDRNIHSVVGPMVTKACAAIPKNIKNVH